MDEHEVKEPTKHDRARTEKFTELMEKFSNVCNSFNSDPKDFIEQFCRQHRTLQQSMFGMMVHLLAFMATPEYSTDGRNQYSKELAEKFIKGYGDVWQQHEIDILVKVGYDLETATAKASEYRKDFDKRPSYYLGLPCV
jgi:hypothetical protein